MDVFTPTLMLLPDMFQIRTSDEYQIDVADHLTAIANHTTGPCRILQKIQLHHVVAVNGKVEFLFVTVGHIHKVVFTQWGDFA